MKIEERTVANIVELVASEQARLEKNQDAAGDAFLYAEKAVDILNAAVTGVTKDAQLFGHAWSMVRRDGALAFLSTLRGHRVQASLCLRHLLETACIAFYAAGHPDDYSKILYEKDDVLKAKIYRWLKSNHPDASESIRSFKSRINSLDSHSNIENVMLMEDYYSGGLPWAESFFDSDDITMVQTALIDVVDTINVVLIALVDISATTLGVSVDPDVEPWIDEVWLEAAEMRKGIVDAYNAALRVHWGLPQNHVFPWQGNE